jgi:GT2 family glycosyltransferase
MSTIGELMPLKNLQIKPCISFIILTWNSERFLHGCFESIINKCHDENIVYEVIVVDNGSSDSSTNIVRQYQENHTGQFDLICLGKNRGTTYPRNIGLKKARGEYMCILDSDTEMGEGCLSDIFSRLSSDKMIGIIAPRLLLPDGVTQHSVKRFPTMINKLIKIPRIMLGIKTRNADFYEDFPFVEEHEADSAISACWFFQRGLLDSVGFLDERIFYAPEDVDYSLRVWKAGYSLRYYPAFTVLHHTQQITHKNPLSITSMHHFLGLVYYYLKHGGWIIRPKVT